MQDPATHAESSVFLEPPLCSPAQPPRCLETLPEYLPLPPFYVRSPAAVSRWGHTAVTQASFLACKLVQPTAAAFTPAPQPTSAPGTATRCPRSARGVWPDRGAHPHTARAQLQCLCLVDRAAIKHAGVCAATRRISHGCISPSFIQPMRRSLPTRNSISLIQLHFSLPLLL